MPALKKPRQPEPSLGPPSEAEDVLLAQKGDGDAFRRLMEHHQADMARLMWRFSRDPQRHSELVQDAFVEAYMSLSGYRQKGPFGHWLRKIGVRVGLAHWRQRKARPQMSLEQAAGMLAEEPDRHGPQEAAELVERLLSELPPRDRLVLTLLHLDGRSVAETAEMTGWSQAMVKVQAWRARKKMHDVLRKLGLDESEVAP